MDPDDSDADAAALRARVDALEQTVSEQQATIEALSSPTPSRRGVLKGAAAMAGLGAVGWYSSYPARAQAAGQVGTSAEPVDVEAWSLNVQDSATLGGDLDAGGNDLTNVGAAEVEELKVINNANFPNETYIEATRSTSDTGIAAGTYSNIFDGESVDSKGEFNSSAQFVPNETAKYRLTGTVSFAGISDGDLIQARVRNITDSSFILGAGDVLQIETGGGFPQAFPINLVAEFTAGKAYEFRARDNDTQFDLEPTRAVISREFSSI